MYKLKIGIEEFHYYDPKELFSDIVKEFYYSDANIFKDVRIFKKDILKVVTPIFVKLKKPHPESYFDMSKTKYDEWKKIIGILKSKYSKKVIKEDEVVEPVDEEFNETLKKYIEKVEKIKLKDTYLSKLLRYSPIDENGQSEYFYFKNLSPDDSKIDPTNGIHWDRACRVYFKMEYIKEKGTTVAFRFNGYNLDNDLKNRAIRKDIREPLQDLNCVHCGAESNKNHLNEIDHKNGRYNDSSALDIETQELEDFQTLCSTCNKTKRSICMKCVENGIRYDATILGYPMSVVEGDLAYDKSLGENACVGCYFNDVQYFRKMLTFKKE